MADVGSVGPAPTVGVPLDQLVTHCRKAKAAGVESPLCSQFDQLAPEQPKQSSWLWTATKVVVVASALYGMYWYGVGKAADVGGKKFEEFVEMTANMTSEARESFYEGVREMMGKCSAIPLLESGKETARTYLPAGVYSAAQRGFRSVADFAGYAKEATLNGKLATQFADFVKGNTPGPNLNVAGSLKDTATEVTTAARSIGTGVKYGGYGVGLFGGTYALSKVISPVKTVLGELAGPAKTVVGAFAKGTKVVGGGLLKVYAHSPLPGSSAVRNALRRGV